MECCRGAGRGGPPPLPKAMEGAEGFFVSGLCIGGRLAGGGEGRRLGLGSCLGEKTNKYKLGEISKINVISYEYMSIHIQVAILFLTAK